MIEEKKQQQYSIDLKLFVGSIKKEIDEKKLKDLFSPFGPILDVTMITKRADRNQGSAFVRFQSMTDAEKAVKNFSELSSEMGGIIVKWADGERERLGVQEDQQPKLYAGPFPKDSNELSIGALFQTYGTIAEIQIINKNGINLAAYIIYQNKESCVLAIRNLNKIEYMRDQPLEVRFANTGVLQQAPSSKSHNRYELDKQQHAITTEQNNNHEPEQDPIKEYMKSYTRWLDSKKKPYYVHWETGEVRKQVPPVGSIVYSPDGSKEIITREKYLNDLAAFNSKKTGPAGSNLFVFHLPNDHKDSDLMELFSPYGNVISARVMTEPRSGKSKGFGFVSFDRPESAAKAKEAMDGFLIDKKKLSVTFKQNDGSSQPFHYQSLPTIKLIQFDPYDW